MNRLFLGDCLEVMKSIDNHSVDMILCDLPYGVTKNKWDSPIPLNRLWHQYHRIIKPNGVIALFATQPFASLLVTSSPKDFKYELVWRKNTVSGFLSSKNRPLSSHESILIFYDKKPTYNPQFTYSKPYARIISGKRSRTYGDHHIIASESKDGRRFPISVIEFNSVPNENRLHQTQKPIELCEWLIKTFSNKGDIILDSCMGSGTTILAAINTRRRFIGIEKSRKFYSVTNIRIALMDIQSDICI